MQNDPQEIVCVYMGVKEKQKERNGDRKSETERKKEKKRVECETGWEERKEV